MTSAINRKKGFTGSNMGDLRSEEEAKELAGPCTTRLLTRPEERDYGSKVSWYVDLVDPVIARASIVKNGILLNAQAMILLGVLTQTQPDVMRLRVGFAKGNNRLIFVQDDREGAKVINSKTRGYCFFSKGIGAWLERERIIPGRYALVSNGEYAYAEVKRDNLSDIGGR